MCVKIPLNISCWLLGNCFTFRHFSYYKCDKCIGWKIWKMQMHTHTQRKTWRLYPNSIIYYFIVIIFFLITLWFCFLFLLKLDLLLQYPNTKWFKYSFGREMAEWVMNVNQTLKRGGKWGCIFKASYLLKEGKIIEMITRVRKIFGFI